MTLPRGKWILKMKRELSEKRSRSEKKSIIQQQLNELWFQTRARPRLSSKYCSFADAIAQNGRLFFASSFAFVVLIFYLFGILCSFLIIIVNGKNVLSWCVSFGTFLSFLPSIWHFSLCRCSHSTKCIQFRAHSYYTFRCAYTRSCLFFFAFGSFINGIAQDNQHIRCHHHQRRDGERSTNDIHFTYWLIYLLNAMIFCIIFIAFWLPLMAWARCASPQLFSTRTRRTKSREVSLPSVFA